MKKATVLFTFLILCFGFQESNAYSYLRIRDPRNWGSGTGTIEEATFSIRPKGLYMECGMYLTFSARGLNFSATDSLEVEFYFTLPKGSIVHDSWLWIEGEIIKGDIMDRWTAASIYEDIVKRRRDPSILFKRSEDYYELRIFPMVMSEPRKVKITFLLPTNWSESFVTSPLPVDLLSSSRYRVEDVHLFSWMDEGWQNPQIIEYPNSFFQSKSDETFGNYQSLKLPNELFQNPIHFSVDSPLKDGMYLSTRESGGQGFYQLAFSLSDALGVRTAKNVVVLLDYKTANSSISKQDLLRALESSLKINFSDKDAFNVFYSEMQTRKVFSSWQPAHSTSIESAFSTLRASSIGSYSNLQELFSKAIEFINANNRNATILLVSNTDFFQDYISTNTLIRDLEDLMLLRVPIHIVDFQDYNYKGSPVGNTYYYGNEYLYTNLTRLFNGNYANIRNGGTLATLLDGTVPKLGGFVKSFDFHPTIAGGYTFGRFSMNDNNQSIYVNEPVLQVGKYNGSGDFELNIAGEFGGEIFSESYNVDSNMILEADTLVEEMWVGQYIEELEQKEQTNDVVNEIVELSVGERVLSIFSAFLCLEPARGGKVCYDCLDESILVNDVVDLTDTESDSLCEAAPNPFNATTKIRVRIPQHVNAQDMSFEIYNILGRRIKTFTPQADDSRDFNFLWDGRNESGQSVSSGTYLFVVRAGNYRQTLKLVLMK